jgi:hypothetical protein
MLMAKIILLEGLENKFIPPYCLPRLSKPFAGRNNSRALFIGGT